MKKVLSFSVSIIGLFRLIARGLKFKHDVFEIVTKTSALAYENFMTALVAYDYDSCLMEGFDNKRVEKY
tara:strand:+ start:1377 stop:1583 length:207 start_codon:yes stop_codon:yes gene_type:complete